MSYFILLQHLFYCNKIIIAFILLQLWFYVQCNKINDAVILQALAGLYIRLY